MRRILLALSLFVPLTYCVEADAQSPSLTAADIAAFFDGMMPQQLAREDIAGVVIAIVKDNQVVFAKGYGYADVAKKTLVSADATLFRLVRFSKLFVWTSVMQQVEQGKLDLDRDVNEYVDFKIPAYDGKPITLRNIMTHTAGFEEAIKELFVSNAAMLTPLSQYLPSHMPGRIFPRSDSAYSNYATALAAYVVQRVSGVPFVEYVDRFIYKPLQMNRTTFAQPLPANLAPMMSTGYAKGSGAGKSFEFVEAFPAGSVSASAMDMTRFMMAHLRDGELDGARILKEETARLMHSRQFAVNPALNAMALGFYEETRNGHRIIGHGGDTAFFHSNLHLMADSNLGFFISYNSAGKGEIDARGEVWNAFLDRYFPYTIPPATTLATAKQDAASVAGSYTSSRRPATNILSVIGLLSTMSIHADADGNLVIPGFRSANGVPKKWREIAPQVWRETDGQDLITFQKDATGLETMGMGYPFMVLQKTGFGRNGVFNQIVGGGSLLIILLTIVLWPVAAAIRWHYGSRRELEGSGGSLVTGARVLAAFNLIAVIVLVSVGSKTGIRGALNSSLDFMLRFMQVCLLIGMLGAVVAVLGAARVLTAKTWWFTKVQAAVFAVACVGFTWFIVHWNFLHASLMF